MIIAMSDCSGPNCTHPSHKMDKPIKETTELVKEPKAKLLYHELTRNQKKALRRKLRGK